MRLDLFLKKTRLVKRRTIAQEMCDAGRVQVNGHEAKPAKEVKQGDRITIRFSSRTIDLDILNIPASSNKTPSETFYTVTSETRSPGEKELWNENPS